jgi:hypothetical protein
MIVDRDRIQQHVSKNAQRRDLKVEFHGFLETGERCPSVSPSVLVNISGLRAM